MTEIEKLCAQLKLKEAENRRLQIENDVLKSWRNWKGGEAKPEPCKA